MLGAPQQRDAVTHVPMNRSVRPDLGPVVSITASATRHGGRGKDFYGSHTTLSVRLCDSVNVVCETVAAGAFNTVTVIHGQHLKLVNAFLVNKKAKRDTEFPLLDGCDFLDEADLVQFRTDHPDALMWSIDQKAGDALLLTAGSISQARQTKVNLRSELEYLGPHALPRLVHTSDLLRSARLALAKTGHAVLLGGRFADKLRANSTFVHSMACALNLLEARNAHTP